MRSPCTRFVAAKFVLGSNHFSHNGSIGIRFDLRAQHHASAHPVSDSGLDQPDLEAAYRLVDHSIVRARTAHRECIHT